LKPVILMAPNIASQTRVT